MNSTKKYIQDKEMIDLVRFKNTDIKSLEIWIGDGQRQKRTLRKKYKINTNGRI